MSLANGRAIAVFVVTVIFTAIIFALDVLLPLGHVVWVLYILSFLLALGLPQRATPFVLAGACTVLMMLGFLYSPSGIAVKIAVFNRVVGILVLWGAAVLLWQRRQAEVMLQRAHNEMENKVQERTAELTRANAVLKAESEERRRVEEALRATNSELETFAYSVSHDLRAPLRGIDVFSRSLLDTHADKLDSEGTDCLQNVRSTSQRMAQLVDDLLYLSHASRSQLRRDAVNLSELAQEIATGLLKVQCSRRVNFIIASGVVARGDERLLKVMLENLLGNAWKFTEKRPRARIEFGVIQHEGMPAYFVRDDGVGFNMAHAQKLFDAFHRLHAMSEFEGSGIGLATVKRIVQRHGGRIWAEGAVDLGATFYFSLEPARVQAELSPV